MGVVPVRPGCVLRELGVIHKRFNVVGDESAGVEEGECAPVSGLIGDLCENGGGIALETEGVETPALVGLQVGDAETLDEGVEGLVCEGLVEDAEGIAVGDSVVVGDEDVQWDAREVVCGWDDLGFGILVVGGEIGNGGHEFFGVGVGGTQQRCACVYLSGTWDGTESAGGCQILSNGTWRGSPHLKE